jgi:hypothetical protein
MNSYQIKFRVSEAFLVTVLDKLRYYGPLVVEVVDEVSPTKETIREDISKLGRDMLAAAQKEGMNLNWKQERPVRRRRAITGVGSAAVMAALQKEPLPYYKMRQAFISAGLAPTGFGSCLAKLRVRGDIVKTNDGTWALAEKKETE